MISAFSRVAVFALTAVLGLAACETNNPFTTAGSLRVEVRGHFPKNRPCNGENSPA